MLLIVLKQARERKEEPTFTQLGEILGCSRQNIKKLAIVLEKNGWCKILKSENDVRTSMIVETKKLTTYFSEINAYNEKKLAQLFQVFSDKELQMFYELMNKMNNFVSEMEEENE